MNSVYLIGNLTRDIEIRYSQNGNAMAKFTLAVNRNRDTADFITCQAFGKTAEILENRKKGTRLAIMGNLKTGSYEKDGRKVYTTDVYVDKLEFMDKRDPLEDIL